MINRLFQVFVSHSLPMLFTVLVLGLGAMTISHSSVARNSEMEALNQLEQIQAYYEVIVAEMDSLNLVISTNPAIINSLRYMLELETWAWMDISDFRIIHSFFSAPANARPYIESIYIYLENSRGRILTSETGITTISAMNDTGWFDSFRADGGKSEFRAEYALPMGGSRGYIPRPILRISRTIYDTKPQPIGLIVLNLRADRLVKDYPSSFFGEGSFFVVSDINGKRLLSVPREPDIEPERLSRDYVSFSLVSRRFGWNYELNIPESYLYRLPRAIGLITLAMSLGACVMGLLLTHKSSQKERWFLKNVLERLDASGTRKIGTGPGKDNVFDYLNSRILRTFLEQDYLRMQKEVLEYRALQMQINPHFLFNTLDTINWSAIALLKGPNDVSRMIQLLSRLLEYSIEISENPGVPLAEEIARAKDYLELQNIRFAGKFLVRWNINAPINIQVPRLILQPILENSFTHGFGEDRGLLEILVSVTRKEGRTIISLEDNGEGMDKETLERINSGGTPKTSGSVSIGLANVRKRIILFYKDQAEITITGEKKKGTQAIISIPETL